jgi:hypothetical protein
MQAVGNKRNFVIDSQLEVRCVNRIANVAREERQLIKGLDAANV